MTPRIQKAIDIFLDAINNSTLAKGTCAACAVGNLVAIGMNAEIEYNQESQEFDCDKSNHMWGSLFSTCNGVQDGSALFVSSEERDRIIKKNIEVTDFSLEELMKIEYAFETNTKILMFDYPKKSLKKIRADQIKGLEAVVKVMLTFDEQTEDVKEVFTHKAELIPI